MSRSSITRRQFNKWLAASLLLSSSRVQAQMAASEDGSVSGTSPIRLHVAAIQMVPKLGDVQANVNQAEALVRKALGLGARWIVLPEMFTSGAAFHPDMHNAIQPFDGAPLQLLKDLSRKGNAVIGGSFLAKRGQHVFNTFVLVSPDGSVVTHDKIHRPIGKIAITAAAPMMACCLRHWPVGSVLCWEFIAQEPRDGWQTRSRWSWEAPVGGRSPMMLIQTAREEP